ncbi:MAG: hypothetical protein OHK93_003838 [Ramalina farinacea]|uniref:Uncharacterized protein n=1 Tax=Ramalina farinacea TaxID=258253 RepID=A0AA43QHA6_9LECA|nr:hypothetical protein [Ramalina farinacea]
MNNHNNNPPSSSGYIAYQPPPTQTTTTTTHSAFPPRISSSNKTLPQPPPPPHPTSSPSSATTTTTTASGYNNPLFTSRRTPSQSTTTSTHSTHRALYPARHPSDVSSSRVSRTSSTRSSNPSPSSYVALMRKQKATVWCDRSQHEDPRTVAQKKAAKIRAAREISGPGALDSTGAGRTSTSGSFTGSGSLGVRSKIRHHGVTKASAVGGYSTANMVGGGVPMRLSANEVGDEGTYRGNPGGGGANNGGTGSGRHVRTSSAHSRDSRVISSSGGGGGGQYLTVDTQGSMGSRRMSQGSTPVSGGGGGRDSIPELSEEVEKPPPLPSKDSGEGAYWGPAGRRKSGLSEGDRENSFGKLGGMDAPVSASKVKPEGKSEDDLRRRGSVDERANTMGFIGGGRLFVANPDLSD